MSKHGSIAASSGRRGRGLLLGVLVAGCASGLPREQAQLAPDPSLEGTLARTAPLTVELAQEAYVAVLGMTWPTAEEPGHPILFDPRYPRFPTDRRVFGEGRHRLVPRQRAGFWPMHCSTEETPTIDGCRRPHYLLPGAGSFYATRPPHAAVLVIVSDAFVDPFPLAEQLYWELMKDWQRAQRLTGADVDTVAEELEPLLIGALGETGWTASFGRTF